MCTGVVEYIKELCEAGEKFICFANHIEMVKAIQSCVEKAGVDYFMIMGETPADERKAGVQRFQADEKCKVAILSIGAASQGITLTAASTVVFAELHWTPGLIEQAEDRAHRIGQVSAVNIYYLISQGTLDTMMWHMINKKVNIISKALNGKKQKMGADNKTAAEMAPDGAGGARDEPVSDDTVSDDAPGDDSDAGLAEAAAEWKADVRPAHEPLPQNDLRSFFSKGSSKRRRVGDSTPVSEDPWACTACTFNNVPSGMSGNKILGLKSCQMCGTPRSKKKVAAAAAVAAVAEVDQSPGAGAEAKDDADEPLARLKFCVSAHTGRIWLYNRFKVSLGVTITQDDARMRVGSGLPGHLSTPPLLDEIHAFARAWDCLRAVEQKGASNTILGKINTDVAQRVMRDKSRGSATLKTGGENSTVRFTPKEAFFGAARSPPTSASARSTNMSPQDTSSAVVSARKRAPAAGSARRKSDATPEPASSRLGSDLYVKERAARNEVMRQIRETAAKKVAPAAGASKAPTAAPELDTPWPAGLAERGVSDTCGWLSRLQPDEQPCGIRQSRAPRHAPD